MSWLLLIWDFLPFCYWDFVAFLFQWWLSICDKFEGWLSDVRNSVGNKKYFSKLLGILHPVRVISGQLEIRRKCCALVTNPQMVCSGNSRLCVGTPKAESPANCFRCMQRPEKSICLKKKKGYWPPTPAPPTPVKNKSLNLLKERQWCMRERVCVLCVCVCVCVWRRERKCVCMCVKERESVCVCLSVCGRVSKFQELELPSFNPYGHCTENVSCWNSLQRQHWNCSSTGLAADMHPWMSQMASLVVLVVRRSCQQITLVVGNVNPFAAMVFAWKWPINVQNWQSLGLFSLSFSSF